MAIVLTGEVLAGRMINLDVTVREKQTGDSGQYIVIEKKPLQIQEGIKTTCFIVNFTLDLTVSRNDSGFFDCQFSLTTLGPQPQTFVREFHGLPGGVYFVDDVCGKDSTLYRVAIAPASVDSSGADVTECDFDFHKEGIWDLDPSGNFYLYFVPKSLADARWNLVKEFLETGFRLFKKSFELEYSVRTNFFLSPCRLPGLVWDKRMGYAIDPVRSNGFVVYSHSLNTVDPLPACLIQAYHCLGYAPPVLAEGMSGYFEAVHYYAQQAKEKGQLPPLSKLYKSVDYYALPGSDNLTAAASFVRYLLDTYGLAKFMSLYRSATDLTMADHLKTIYGKPPDELEKEWHHLLDTATYSFSQMKYFYEQERWLYREEGMKTFLAEMKSRMGSYRDSVYVFGEEGSYRYLKGKYQEAQADYQDLIRLSPGSSEYLIFYGNLLMMDGRYDSAAAVYKQALLVDTTAKIALNRLAENFYWQNTFDSAKTYYRRNVEEDRSLLNQATSAIALGELALREHDSVAAAGYYMQALQRMNKIAQYGLTDPTFLMRFGQSYLGLAVCGKPQLKLAQSYLESALYFETYPVRPIFVTRILFELGKLADLQERRSEAVDYYKRALTYPIQPALAKQLEAYLKTPFKGY